MSGFADDLGPIELGERLGSGGEGAVHAIRNRERVVAKLFHDPPRGGRLAKLEALIRLPSSSDMKVYAAWPTGLIRQHEKVVGLVMPLVDGRQDIHALYGPRSRKRFFPNADWAFLVRVAANIARAFGAVHASGCVIGDVNHGGVMVAQDATVTLIDCDSFQFDLEGKTHLCGMGVPTFTPPELQGKSLRRVKRTVEHDSFGLAVLVFQILFLGRHPFAGRFLGRGDKSIEEAIQEFRFAYGPGSRSRKMEQPPGTPDLATASDEVAALFERAFGEQASVSAGRPAPSDWIEALTALESRLAACERNVSHKHLADLDQCPWCRIENTVGTVLFHFSTKAGPGSGPVNITALWAEIESIPEPEDEERLLDQLLVPPPSQLARAGQRKFLFRYFGLPLLATLAGVAVLQVVAFLWWAVIPVVLFAIVYLRNKFPPSDIARHFEREAIKAKDRERRYLGSSGKMMKQGNFSSHYYHLRRLRDELAGMDRTLRDRLKELEDNRELVQRDAYSDGFTLANANIPNFGETRMAMLQSYGIESVADLHYDRLVEIPGIGESLAKDALEWRLAQEEDFRFDPWIPVEKERIQRVEQEVQARKQAIVDELRDGPRKLKAIARDIENERKRRLPKLMELRQKRLQAEADRYHVIGQ
ncbi:MAG: hypothetical protein ACMVY4_08890 [Minwuia sp.]|uniref:hypothetical protein n=1 Tax=Minwuia sp. TaxID=2493630 RepID=UPI003A8961EA